MVFVVQIPVNAPETARGELEITYVDEELRLVVNANLFFTFFFYFFVNKHPKTLCSVSVGCQGVTRATCLY